MDFLERSRQRKKDMRFVTLNVRSFYRADKLQWILGNRMGRCGLDSTGSG
jgi:hypothetical protein